MMHRREVKPVRDREHLVELELLVLRVDGVVGKLSVRTAAVVVEPAGVPGERSAAPLEAEGVPLVHVEREAEAEGWSDRRPALHCEGGLAVPRLTVGALLQAGERCAAEQVQISIREDALE